MAEVFIESLSIENFGPYYGAHEFKFSSLDGRSGILIGGKNGAGKTHLLRALYLAVVGESGPGDLKRVEAGADATRFLFDKALNRKAEAEGIDTIRLSITMSLRDEGSKAARKATIFREIRVRQNSPSVWKSYAKKSDNSNQIDDEQVIQKLRDAFLPRHLARFFFFDAERSQSINLGHQDIVEGVSRILGLWTYGELEDDLRQLIQSKIPKIYGSNGASEAEIKLVDITADVLKAEGHLKARIKELGRTQTETTEAEAELAQVEDDLRSLGAVDPQELEGAQSRRLEITKVKAEMESQLTAAWEIGMPVALLGGFRRNLHDYLSKEEKRRNWDSSKAAVEPKIPQVKEDVFENAPKEFALKSDHYSFYSSRLEKALLRLFNPPPEGMSESVYVAERNDISAQVRLRLSTAPASLGGVVDLCIKVEQLDTELRELDQKLKRLNQSAAAIDNGRELHQKRGALTVKLAQLQKQRGDLVAEIAKLELEIAELKREETNQREIAEKAEKGQSIAALAAKYREAVSDIKSRAAIQLRKRISPHVGELWVDITERHREFTGLEFDSHWNCLLIRRDGKKVPWDETNTSAGQRQVRMLAFYEALRRLAKQVPPLVVDTPLGRLDKEIKNSVLDQLYLSGHQSIILSTNSEIDPDGVLFEEIQDRLARVYTLHPHGKEGSLDYEVRVTSDYFGKEI